MEELDKQRTLIKELTENLEAIKRSQNSYKEEMQCEMNNLRLQFRFHDHVRGTVSYPNLDECENNT